MYNQPLVLSRGLGWPWDINRNQKIASTRTTSNMRNSARSVPKQSQPQHRFYSRTVTEPCTKHTLEQWNKLLKRQIINYCRIRRNNGELVFSASSQLVQTSFGCALQYWFTGAFWLTGKSNQVFPSLLIRVSLDLYKKKTTAFSWI